MPVFKFQDPQSGKIATIEGESEPTEQELEQVFASINQQSAQQPQEQESSFLGQLGGALETAATIGTGAIAEPAAGIAGLASAPFVGVEQAVKNIEAVRDQLTYSPDSPESKAQLQAIGKAIQPVVGAVQAVESTLGNAVLDATGSPELAAIAHSLPAATLELIGVKGMGGVKGAAAGVESAGSAVAQGAKQVAGGIQQGVEQVAGAIQPAAQQTAKSFQGRAGDLFTFQTPYRKRIAEKIAEGSTDIDASKFKLTGEGRAIPDKFVANAVKQGFDEGVIADIKNASSSDKNKMLRMVHLMEKGKNNRRFAQENRPSDVAGETLIERFRAVKKANEDAGNQLDSVADTLRGKQIDNTPIVNSFLNDLESIGVGLGDDLKPIFHGSDIEGAKGAVRIIKKIIDRIDLTKEMDAHDMHRLKRFIDEQVSYGKAATSEGLTGRTELILKNLRRNVDGILDQNFPAYDRVNTAYSETIGAIDALQDVAGRKMDLTGPNADKATGTLLRRVMGNQQSRVRLLDSIKDIEDAASKYGGIKKGKNDLFTQALFFDELDSLFGPVARTSFQGQVDQPLKRGVDALTSRAGAVDLGVEVAGKLAERARGINEEGAFKAIKELLKQGTN